MPTLISIFANAAPFLPSRVPFSSERRSKTGSITLQGGQVWGAVNRATAARWAFKKWLNDAGFVMMCNGPVKELVARVEGPGWLPTCEATACSIALASWGSWGLAVVGVGVATPGEGPRNMASIVGRSAAPNGVERKSLGRSLISCEYSTLDEMVEEMLTLDKWRDTLSSQKSDAIVSERIAVEVYWSNPWTRRLKIRRKKSCRPKRWYYEMVSRARGREGMERTLSAV